MFLRYNVFTVIWALFILFVTLMPGDAMPNLGSFTGMPTDKLAHMASFAILVFLSIIGFSKQHRFKKVQRHASQFALVFALVYGLVIELLQVFIPGRAFEIFDFLANLLGACLGYVCFLLVYKVK